MILSQIGKPIDHPKAASAQIIVDEGYNIAAVHKEVEGVMDSWLEDIGKITEMMVDGKIRTF
jgi:S-adenosylmethionine synthetase